MANYGRIIRGALDNVIGRSHIDDIVAGIRRGGDDALRLTDDNLALLADDIAEQLAEAGVRRLDPADARALKDAVEQELRASGVSAQDAAAHARALRGQVSRELPDAVARTGSDAVRTGADETADAAETGARRGADNATDDAAEGAGRNATRNAAEEVGAAPQRRGFWDNIRAGNIGEAFSGAASSALRGTLKYGAITLGLGTAGLWGLNEYADSNPDSLVGNIRERITEGADRAATTQAIESEYNDNVLANISTTGTDTLRQSFLDTISGTMRVANSSDTYDDFDEDAQRCLLEAADDAFDNARRVSGWSPSNNTPDVQARFVEALRAGAGQVSQVCELSDNQRAALNTTVFNQEGQKDSFIEVNFDM